MTEFAQWTEYSFVAQEVAGAGTGSIPAQYKHLCT
jgi:hypothetical protein